MRRQKREKFIREANKWCTHEELNLKPAITGVFAASSLKEFLGTRLADRIKEAEGKGKFSTPFSDRSYRRTTNENHLEASADSLLPAMRRAAANRLHGGARDGQTHHDSDTAQ